MVGELRAYPQPVLSKVFGDSTEYVWYPRAELSNYFPHTHRRWLYGVCRGQSHEPLRPRTLPQSIGCGKNFLGPEKLSTCRQVRSVGW